MILNPLQLKAYETVAAALPVRLDPLHVEVEHAPSYVISTVKAHDYAAGVMAAMGSAIEHLGRVRGLPRQTLTLNRRRCGFLLNALQLQFVNGYSTILDTWGVNPDNGTYRAADGRHVTMIGMHPHLRDKLLAYFDCCNTAAAIQKAVERKTAQEIEDDAVRLDLPLGVVRTPAEWAAHPQGAATLNRPIVDFEVTKTEKRRVLGAARSRPLEGVRVVELTHMIAGPASARLLAEQGAEVIKIQPPMGDWVLPIWLDGSWGKKNILLDIKSRHGKARLAELLSTADVLIDGQRPGALAGLGLDDAALRGLNPNLIHASLSCFARGTPWETRRGFEQIAQAVSGTMHVHSQGMDAPTVVPALVNDYLTAYLLVAGVVAALAEREENGGFYHVGASLSRTSSLAPSLIEDIHADAYLPVTMQDLMEHAIDQETPSGVFTRIAPAVAFSHTPAYVTRHPTLMGVDPDSTGWEDPAPAATVPHYPSKLAREGGIRNLVSCNGIEDRSDGGGVMSLASKSLIEYVLAHRND
jgi:crotonobetainyl-CoA:carnitine CoA-transferase CaiB-like acyl-CoA transferase